MTMTDEERAVVGDLRRAITTASNDDQSEPHTEDRQRYIARINAMLNAADLIDRNAEARATIRREARREAMEESALVVEAIEKGTK